MVTKLIPVPQITKNPEFDIFSMKPELQAIIDKNFDNEDLEYEIPGILPTSPAKKLELTWLAGRLAFLFPANKSLAESSNVENSAKYNSESFFLIGHCRSPDKLVFCFGCFSRVETRPGR